MNTYIIDWDIAIFETLDGFFLVAGVDLTVIDSCRVAGRVLQVRIHRGIGRLEAVAIVESFLV